MQGARVEGAAGDYNYQFRQYDAGVPWQKNYNDPGYQVQEHGNSNNHLPGATPQFGGYNDDPMQYTMPRPDGIYGPDSSQMHRPNYEKPAQNSGATGVPWQGNHNNQGYPVQEHGNFNNYLPGATSQFGEYNDDPMQYKSQGDTYGSASSQMHKPNFEKPAQNSGAAGDQWQGNYNNQRSLFQDYIKLDNPNNNSCVPGTNGRTAGDQWQGNYNNQVHEHDNSKNHNISPLSTPFSDATIAQDISFGNAHQTGPQDQTLTGNYPQNLQKEIHQDTNNSAGNNFNSNQTTSGQIPQWIPGNNDNLGLMELDWVYPEGICNFETYSNHVGVIDPWKEIQAERAQAPLSFAPDTPQMGNNEGESSSQEARADKIRLASRKTDDPNLTTEEKDKKAAERAASRGYTAKYNQKMKETRESYKNEAELLSKKILRPHRYRRNIEKNMLFVREALKKWYPDFLLNETNGYLYGKKVLYDKFKEHRKEDKEITAADEEYFVEIENFWEAFQDFEQTKSTTAASRQSRAKTRAMHWENVYNVLDYQWTLLYETKLAGLATLYVRRTMPTVISKLNPILKDVEKQCEKDEKVQEYEDFKEFLKEHRPLFMVQKKSLPSESTGFKKLQH